MTDYISEFEKGYEAYQKKDYKTTLAIWEPLVQKNVAWAIENVALLYATGHGVKYNAANTAYANKLFAIVGKEGGEMVKVDASGNGNVRVYYELADPRKNNPTNH